MILGYTFFFWPIVGYSLDPIRIQMTDSGSKHTAFIVQYNNSSMCVCDCVCAVHVCVCVSVSMDKRTGRNETDAGTSDIVQLNEYTVCHMALTVSAISVHKMHGWQ